MRKIDNDGLLLCSFQANVFSSSLVFSDTSSEIFIRRFMNSDVVKEFDSNFILDDSLTINGVLEKVEEEFGYSSYGSIKYDKEVLYWIGYIYRYMSYTYNLSSKFVYKLIKPKELNELYFTYHTFDCGQAIERIFEDKHISFDIDAQNELLLEMMRERLYNSQIAINLDNKKNKDSILLIIHYQNKKIGLIALKKNKDGTYNLKLTFNDNEKNETFRIIALKKCLVFIKEKLVIKNLIVKLNKTDEVNLNLFKKLDFVYEKEKSDSVYYTKSL